MPKEKKSDVSHIRRISYRMNGSGYHFSYRTHLFIVSPRGGRPRQLTRGEWDATSPSWSVDGKKIFFSSNIEENTDYTRSHNLYSVTIRGGRPRKLCGLRGYLHSPSPSPDGKTVAFVGSDRRRGNGTNDDLYLVPIAGGRPRNISKQTDLSIGQSVISDSRIGSPGFAPVWSPDGSEIKFLAAQNGSDRLFSLHLKAKELNSYTTGDTTVESVSYNEDHTSAAYTQMSATELAELWLWREGRAERRLTRLNDPLLARLHLSEPERFTFNASDRTEVEGWLMLPPASRRQKHPAILQIHGGPRAAYGYGFLHEFHLLNARGFAVFYINPRGSSSYGEDWASAVPKHFGERDYRDIMEAVDLIARRRSIDRNNIGVSGGSYGGFMTNWIVGHTERFKAACTQRCISNWISFFGTSDIGPRFSGDEIATAPWKDLGEFWKRSPLAYVEKVKTPLLIIHAEEDWRCPIEQSEQMFTALKWLGRDVELIRFPGENHELSRGGKPKHRLERLAAIVKWFEIKMK